MIKKTVHKAGAAISSLVLFATSVAAQEVRSPNLGNYGWSWPSGQSGSSSGWSWGSGSGSATAVPEIDASTGALALAAVAAGLLLAREMHRRAAR